MYHLLHRISISSISAASRSRSARYSGEHRLPACGRRQLADDIFGCEEIALSEDLFGKLPKRTGWQPVLPGICSRSHDHMIVFELFRFEVPERFRARFGSARILRAVFGILPNRWRGV